MNRLNLASLLKIGFAAWLLGSIVLLYYHASQALSKPHYQFVILIPVVIWWLLWNRPSHESSEVNHSVSPFFLALFTLPWMLLAFAAWVFSPWLGMASIILLGPVTSMAVGGWRLLSSTLGIWLLALFMLPLPLRLDERLILWLREVATTATSRILDYVGILHLISGNVIELPEKKLFVADACSGIHSLFVLLATGTLIAIWNRRGPIATTLLLLITAGVVMIENVLRLLLVCISIRLGHDLSSGVGHTVLGLTLFVLSIVILLSADQLIAFVSIKKQIESDDQTASSAHISLQGARTFACFGLASLLLLPVQWLRHPAAIPNVVAGFQAGIRLPSFGEDYLPKTIGRFSRVGFEQFERVLGDPFGEYSQVWTYRNGPLEATVSLNYSYSGVHDACLCYRNTGWDVLDEQVLGAADTGHVLIFQDSDTSWDKSVAVAAMMRNPLEGHAILVYSNMGESGRTSVKIGNRSTSTTALQASDRFRLHEVEVPERTVQVQVVGNQATPLTEGEQSEVQQLFRAVQVQLLSRVRQELAKR